MADPTQNLPMLTAQRAADQQLSNAASTVGQFLTPTPAGPQMSNAGVGFASRQPGAAPLPQVVVPDQFASRQPTGAHGYEMGQSGYGFPAAAAQPAPGMVTPAANTAVPTAQAAAAPAQAAPTNSDPTLARRIADVPDGGRLVNQPSAGTPPAAAPAYGGVPAGLVNPSAAVSAGFDAQAQRAHAFMENALSYIQGGGDIFEQATRGRAIGNILHAVMGPNNQGQVAGQGQDAFNTALAGIQNSNTAAAATEHSADSALTRQHDADAAAWQREMATPVQGGGQTTITPFGPMTTSTYYQRTPGPGGGMVYSPIGVQAERTLPPGLKVGAPYKGQDGVYDAPGGRKVTVKNGQVAGIQ